MRGHIFCMHVRVCANVCHEVRCHRVCQTDRRVRDVTNYISSIRLMMQLNLGSDFEPLRSFEHVTRTTTTAITVPHCTRFTKKSHGLRHVKLYISWVSNARDGILKCILYGCITEKHHVASYNAVRFSLLMPWRGLCLLHEVFAAMVAFLILNNVSHRYC